MSEQEFNECTPYWFVRRLNGHRAAEKSRINLMIALVRDICYYAGNGGNFKKGVNLYDIYMFPHEKEQLEQRRKRLKIELEEEKEKMKNWPVPNFRPPKGQA